MATKRKIKQKEDCSHNLNRNKTNDCLTLERAKEIESSKRYIAVMIDARTTKLIEKGKYAKMMAKGKKTKLKQHE